MFRVREGPVEIPWRTSVSAFSCNLILPLNLEKHSGRVSTTLGGLEGYERHLSIQARSRRCNASAVVLSSERILILP